MHALMTVREVAAEFRVHPETVRRLIRGGRLPTVIGFRPFRVRREVVERMLQGSTRFG